ncbi:unnamed protein product, partial [marine sediment metagenome]
AILGRQAVEEEKKRRVTVSQPTKHRTAAPLAPVKITKPVEKPKEKEEKKEEIPVDRSIDSVGLNDKVVGFLQGSEIYNESQVKSIKELVKIKGIGVATARKIMNKIRE